MKKHLLLTAFCIVGIFSPAQDPHFSQYSYSPLLINPAFAGYINCELRATANYRNQWSGLTKPFETQMISIDGKFKTNLFTNDRDWIGMGAYVYNAVAGDGNLKTLKSSLLVAYNLGLNRDNTNFLSGAISMGFVNRSVDFSKLYFENQFNGSGFNNTGSNENVSNESFYYYDLSAGMMFTFQFQDRYRQPTIQSHIGVSIDHINMPKESFYDLADNRLEQTINIHAGAFGEISEDILLNLEVWYKGQMAYLEYNDIIYGANLLYPVTNYFTVYGGIWNRWSKDVIPMAGFEVSGWRLLFSYDISITDLQPAESLEFSLSKTFCFNSRGCKGLPCPSFGTDVKMFRR